MKKRCRCMGQRHLFFITLRIRPRIRVFHLVAGLVEDLAEDIGSLFLQHLCQRVVGRIDDGLRIRADFKQFTDQAVRLVQDPVIR